MPRFSQIRYSSGPNSPYGGGSFLGRLIAAIVGIIVLGVSVFLGAVFIAAVIGLMLIGGLVVALRVWWLKRQMARHQAEHGDLEAEYTVVQEEQHTIRRDDP